MGNKLDPVAASALRNLVDSFAASGKLSAATRDELAGVLDGRSTGEPERLLTKREVAEVLRVSGRCLERWVAQGRLRAQYLGPRLIRFRRADVEDLLGRGKR